MNLYQYVRNASLCNIDPMGLFPEAPRVEDLPYVVGESKSRFGQGINWLKGTQSNPAVMMLGAFGGASNLSEDAAFVALAGMSKSFFPGGTGSGANAFFYTCKCGWIDTGHFFLSAALARAIKIIGDGRISSNSAEEVAYKLTHVLEKDQQRTRLTGRSPMMNGAGKNTTDSDGWATSAFTLEDLPTNRMGARFGSRLNLGTLASRGEKMWWTMVGQMQWPGRDAIEKRVIEEVRQDLMQEFVSMMKQCKPVWRYNDVDGGPDVVHAETVLRQDAERYGQAASAFKFNYPAGGHELPNPYSFDDQWKKTASHSCVCDEND
jgi:hypothetical protein